MELIAYEDKQFDSGGNLTVEQQVIKVTAKSPGQVTYAAIVNALKNYKSQPDAERFDPLRDKPRRSGRGRIARTA